MEEMAILELIDRLSNEGRVFHYVRDRYALMLLSWFVRDGRTVRDVKSSRFKGLLEKPVVKSVTSRRRDGIITREALQQWDAAESAAYPITYDLWGDLYDRADHWWQTSRPGMNLVLQVNFPEEHDSGYRRLLRAWERYPFIVRQHPVRTKGYNTMAWARIDIDFESGEALIEEIQSDWIRLAQHHALDAREMIDEGGNGNMQIWGCDGIFQCGAKRLVSYVDEVLQPYAEIWDEVVLAAAIEFLLGEIGIRRIFYHTFDGGNRLKGTYPPRSLYTTLPRRFCFREVGECPAFLDAPISVSDASVHADGRKVRNLQGTIIEADPAENEEPPVRFYLLEL
jgi:hypothetical protein